MQSFWTHETVHGLEPCLPKVVKRGYRQQQRHSKKISEVEEVHS
jgi:hypothetical protein